MQTCSNDDIAFFSIDQSLPSKNIALDSLACLAKVVCVIASFFDSIIDVTVSNDTVLFSSALRIWSFFGPLGNG